MKARRTRNIMLAVVAAIWGLVIWRFLAGDGGKSGKTAGLEVLDIPEVADIPEADTFSLSLAYRDPFLGGLKSKPRPERQEDAAPAPVVQVQAPQPVQPKVVEPPIWSHFGYHGLVKESKSSRTTGLLTADGRMMYVEEGMAYTGFQVLQIWEDSIRIKTDKLTFTLNL